MATMTVETVFIDTNMLVFSRIPSAPFHVAAATAINDYIQSGAELWVSRQVLREFMSTVTRPQKFMTPLPIVKVEAEVRLIESVMYVADETASVTARLVSLLGHVPCGGKQVHDANIVATMLERGIPNLHTHNVADFNRFSNLITIVPLVP